MLSLKSYFFIIKLLISLFLIWFLVHTTELNFSLLLNLLQHPILFFIAISFILLTTIIGAWRWSLLNRAQMIMLPFKKTLYIAYMSTAFNYLLPGSIGGDLIRFHLLSKDISQKKSHITASILTDRIIGLLGIFALFTLVTCFDIKVFYHMSTLFYFLIISFLCGIALLIILTILTSKDHIHTLLTKHFSNKKWIHPIITFFDAIHIYRHQKKVLLQTLLLSMAMQCLIASTCFLLGKMMLFPPISFNHYMIAVAITQIVNLIPIAPGGLGLGEIAFANIITMLNPYANLSYATIFIAYRILGIVAYLPGVFVIFDFQSRYTYNANENDMGEDKL